MRISDWSSDVYSSDLDGCRCRLARAARSRAGGEARRRPDRRADRLAQTLFRVAAFFDPFRGKRIGGLDVLREVDFLPFEPFDRHGADAVALRDDVDRAQIPRSEEHKSEHQSLMSISYDVLRWIKKNR